MTDAWSANTVLLLHMEGDNNSTAFTDNSLFPKTVSVFGGAKISTAKSKWGNGSGYFDGSGDYLTVPHSDYLLLDSDFTIELFVYILHVPGSNIYPRLLSKREDESNGFVIFYSPTGNLVVKFNGTTSITICAYSINTWYHLAISRIGTSIKTFVNGTSSYSGTVSGTIGGTNNLYIGRSYNGGWEFYGYMQDLRITNRAARYWNDFTAPSAILPNPSQPAGLIIPSGYSPDLYDGGAYRIVGTVTELGVEGAYRVRLFDRQSARCVRETWSNASGVYAFDNLAYRANGYFAVAYDHGDNPLNAAIADLITPELMS